MTWGKVAGLVVALVVATLFNSMAMAETSQPAKPTSYYTDPSDWNNWGESVTTLQNNVILDGTTFSTRTLEGTEEAYLTCNFDGGGFIIDGGWSGGTATDGTQALDSTCVKARFSNVNVQNCYTSDYGAVFVDADDSIITLSGTNTFTGNKANEDGGVFSVGTIYLSGTNTFTGNKANGVGAAICAVNTIFLSGTNTFTGNSADKNGGVLDGGDTITISGGTNTFTGNSAGYLGGGVFYGDTTTISGGTNTFTGNSTNSTTGKGGALYCGATTISGGTNTFTGNTDSTGNNDIYSYDSITIQKSAECYFGGGIVITDNYTLEMSKDTSTTTGPNVTFGPGSQTSIGGAFTMSDTNLTIMMGKATPTAELLAINPNINTTSDTTFSAASLTATGHNSLTVYSTLTSVGTEDVITTTGGITGFANISPTLILPSGAPGYLYGEVLLSEDSKKIYVQTAETTYTATNVANKEGGSKLSEAYGKGTLDTNYRQEIVLGANTQETTSTTLTNDSETTPSSWLSVHSNSEDVRTISGADSTTPIIKNEGGTTYLDANNVTFEGVAINASNGSTKYDVYLSGKNVTMNHKSGSLDSTVVVANDFYLQGAEVTFGSKINANVISDLASEITVGVGLTRDDLEITGDFTSNGTIINLDIFQTGSDYTSASGNDSLMVTGTLLLDPSTKICLNPQTSFSTGDDFWVKLTAGTVSDTTLANMQTILDRLASSGPFVNLEYVKGEDGAYYIHGQLVPEPSTWALLILGAAGMWFIRRRHAKK